MKSLILQLFNNGSWWDAAELSFLGNELSSPVRLTYLKSYLTNIASYDATDCWACTINAPVSIVPTDYPGWPSFLDDLLPVGKSRDWWLNYLDAGRQSVFEQNFSLLSHACMAPVGNLRIKEAVTLGGTFHLQTFPIADVVALQHDFLEYANEQGAAVGGATGAVGVAPKLLLMVENDKVFIDADFAGKSLTATPYLTKFARNQRTTRDNQILRAEGAFYRVLTDVLNGTSVQSIDTSTMMLLEHEGQTSLWLPRFDIEMQHGLAIRLGMESIYSMLNAGPGSYQNHFTVMDALWSKISGCTTMSSAEFAKQYLARDFLNVVFGNSDNHGRNISFLKYQNDIQFAPIYDFAPMKADPENITRLFKWGANFEQAGTVRFDKVVQQLSHFAEPAELQSFLNELCKPLLKLPDLLKKYDCPIEMIDFPTLGFARMPEKLASLGVQYE